MKALSIRQPYASLIMIGRKPFEFRSTRTHFRGRIAIHAAKTMGKAERAALEGPGVRDVLTQAGLDPDNLPRSCVLGTAEISNCIEAQTLPQPYKREGFAWDMRLPRVFAQPVPAKGALSFWNWTPDTVTVGHSPTRSSASANVNHVHVATRVIVSAYSAPLADPPNPAAHGGICVREFCGCGAERATNRNNGHHETSDWSSEGAQV